MRIFVAGATGVIGQRAVAQLGARPVTTSPASPARRRRRRSCGGRARRRWRSRSSIPTRCAPRSPGHDAVVNLATKIPTLAQARARQRVGGEHAHPHRGVAQPRRCRDRGRRRSVRAGVDRVPLRRARRRVDRRRAHTARRLTVHRTGAAAEANAARFTAKRRAGSGVAVRRVPGRRQPPHRVDLRRRPQGCASWTPAGPTATCPAIDADDAASAVVAALDARRPASTTSSTTSRSTPATSHGRWRTRSAGAGCTGRPVAGSRRRRPDRSADSQRVSNARFRAVTGWRPVARSQAESDRANGRDRSANRARAAAWRVVCCCGCSPRPASRSASTPNSSRGLLRRLPVRPELGDARWAVQRAPRARLRCDEPRARRRDARRAVLRIARRGRACGRGRLARVLGARTPSTTSATSSHYDTADQIGNVVVVWARRAARDRRAGRAGRTPRRPVQFAPAGSSYDGTREPVDPRRRYLNTRLQEFGTTIFAEMSALAVATGSINLGQGFPDTDGPDAVKRAAIDAIDAGHNQYPPGIGVPALRDAIARSPAPLLRRSSTTPTPKCS